MALLQKIKEKLGFGTGRAERDETDAEVTVESDPAADEGAEEPSEDEPAAAGTEAAASTGSLVDEEPSEDGSDESLVDEADAGDVEESDLGDVDEEPIDAGETDEADETDEVAVDDETEAETTETAPDVSDDDTAAEQAEAADAAEEDVAVDDDDVGTDLEELKGIGPAYAERLAEIGIESVEDLAAADAGAVAEGASVGEKRAATWIDRAKEF